MKLKSVRREVRREVPCLHSQGIEEWHALDVVYWNPSNLSGQRLSFLRTVAKGSEVRNATQRVIITWMLGVRVMQKTAAHVPQCWGPVTKRPEDKYLGLHCRVLHVGWVSVIISI